MTPEEIKAEAHRRAARMDGLNVVQRRAAVARIEGEIRAEAAAAAEAAAKAQASAEALGERKRIASVVAVGTTMGRANAALRLALAGPVDAEAARAVLATLPIDPAGPVAALPATAHFGSEAQQAERARIHAILNCEEAKGRDRTALALALDTSVDLATAAVALEGVPKAETRTYPSLAERSAEAGDFGHQPVLQGKAASEDVWAKAIAATTPRVGAFASGGPAGPVAVGLGGDASARSAELAAQARRWADEERGHFGGA
ncbi:MAG: hypothetical protein JNN06_16540 [Gemmobacter sp.]|uniref:hypothetical protein n=1 Tax=Gemmobacter sp. TaxID=1898957 RepID=UPI001A58D6A1|nr:hypothetical protein [Gemmobacter sp.]MBL8563877.1 hypothetical protein [Gemmobacter sp.]